MIKKIAFVVACLLAIAGVAHASGTNSVSGQTGGAYLLVEPVVEVTETEFTSGQTGSIADPTATCPSGTVLTGGGFVLSDANQLAMPASRPDGSNGWRVRAVSLNSVVHSVTAYALCATVIP